MNLLIYSDLHLERRSFAPPADAVAKADVVVLAGDIHEGIRGFQWARETFPDCPVVYVAGNHEFYGGRNWMRHIDDMREAAQKHGIEFLECDSTEIAGVRFLGCTLWTDFELHGKDRRTAAIYAATSMEDYREIRVSRTPETYWVTSKFLVPQMTASRHRASVEWLQRELATPFAGKTVVVTHHAPHANSIPERYREDDLSPAYASDLGRLMGAPALWIHGHTHDSADYATAATRVVCNPRGYQGVAGGLENDAFALDLTISIGV